MNWRIRIIKRLLKNRDFLLFCLTPDEGKGETLANFHKEGMYAIGEPAEVVNPLGAMSWFIYDTMENAEGKEIKNIILKSAEHYLSRRELETKNFIERIK